MKRFTIPLILILLISSLFSCGHEHVFSEWTVNKEATCNAAGEKIRKCKCGEFESEPISERDHSFIIAISIPPTCTEKGTLRCVCSVCQAIYVEYPEPTEHQFASATCVTPETCLLCGDTVGEPLGHTVEHGDCERCHEFVRQKITLPSIPITVSLQTEGYRTEMQITSMTYEFTGNSIVISYSGVKTADEGTLTNGRYMCGFSYRLYDVQNNLVSSGNTYVFNLAVNETFTDETFYIVSLPEISDFYTLEIDNYIN